MYTYSANTLSNHGMPASLRFRIYTLDVTVGANSSVYIVKY